MTKSYREITLEGLWTNTILFSQTLALCPLLAVTGTATNGLGLGLATTAVLVASGFLISLLRNFIEPEIRIPAYVLIIAGLVTIVDLFMNAYLHNLYKILGLFIPLIVTNCAILGRAESFASKARVLPSVLDGLMMGVGFTFALILLGAVREILGSGTLFAGASLLLGPSFSFLEMTVIPDYSGFLILILPPGGFIMLSLIIVGKRMIDNQFEKARQMDDDPIEPVGKQITI
ncbi:electron transport complex protein RnfE [Cohaesibacter marisflavi]|uniref:Ion-translocating oxidoreductase complex subunit E n=1 Tax=Cohaesibacter marisflavi TaxID=655353 RepID=A0A1I5AGM6_9HYPH|nr:electron transport complex subunit E [Cohaesibacter marisflavi]SFN61631.1 electron transport complex protein RnfE [Cohaesibacter marisflavi]